MLQSAVQFDVRDQATLNGFGYIVIHVIAAHIAARLESQSGALGSLLITYAAGSPWVQTMDIVGEGGALRVARDRIEITRGDKTETLSFPPRLDCRDDVRSELAAFAAAIRGEQPHRNPPEECLRDLALLDAMLRSAQSGQTCTPEAL